ncbi:MFS transporter [Candidatus Micrarchaeota archaeon]|nr:MFS transporter [Candidatus Micrarchaeota archaeon]
MKKLITINFLNSFISSAITIIVPLILLEKNIGITTIGLILSLLPLVFMASRAIFAAVADQIGFRIFFIIQWVTTTSALIFYMFSNSIAFFLLGKISEGLRDGSFWSVNRTAIFYHHRNNEGIAAARFSSIRRVGYALGMLAAGLGLAYLSYNYLILALIFVSMLMGVAAFRLKDKGFGKVNISKTVELLKISNKSKIFWEASVAMFFAGILWTFVTFVLPIYMRSELSLSFDVIGSAFAAYYLIASGATYLGIKFKFSHFNATIAQLLLFGGAAFLIPIAGAQIFFLLLFLLAVGDGISLIIFEEVVATVTKGKSSVSTDISYLHVPSRIAEFLSFSLFGYIIQSFGYSIVFIITAISFVIFSLISYRILKLKNNNTTA